MDYIQQSFFSSKSYLYCTPSYLENNNLPTSIEELSSYSFLVSSYYKNLLPDNVNIRLTSDNLSIIEEMLLSGHGIAVFPYILAKDKVERGELIPILPDLVVVDSAMTLVYPSRTFLSQKSQAMIGLIRNMFEQYQNI